MHSTLSKRSSISEKPGGTPYSPELKDFLTTSREMQTLYANSGGVCNRRVFQFSEKNSVEEYLTLGLHFDKCAESKNLSENERSTVSAYAEKIIDESRKYNLGEIHMNLVWICVFHYEGNSIGYSPLFKIFKNKTSESAVFLNTSFNTYPSWNCFLDCPGMGKSLLCVPRNGAYSFEDDQLQLDFILSNSRKIVDVMPAKSFSQVTVRFCLQFLQYAVQMGEKILKFLKEHKSVIISVLTLLMEFIKIGNPSFKGLQIVSICLSFFEKNCSTEENNCLMRAIEEPQYTNNDAGNRLFKQQTDSATKFDNCFEIDKCCPLLESLGKVLVDINTKLQNQKY